ncbi:MAG: 3D domain-containing protein [Candidatus Goldbacteria bacterium]|nr:3D domain-containing protein [Candidatus Goldiibacteriota bacterium]
MKEKNLYFFGYFILILWLFISLFVIFSKKEYKIKKEIIPFKTVEKYNKKVQKGWNIWLKEGENGWKNVVHFRLSFFNRLDFYKPVYVSKTIKEPADAMVIRGSGDKSHPITVPKDTYVHQTLEMEATGYDPYPDINQIDWAGKTYLGWRARYGIAAVDPNVIPLRRLIFVDGYGFAWTGDTGGAIKGKKIDLCFNSTKEAFVWGRKKVNVYVLGTKPLSQYKKK